MGARSEVSRSQPGAHRVVTRPGQTEAVPLLPLAIATMTLAQILDLGTFVAMLQRVGLDGEANPVIAGLVIGYGPPMAGIAKVALLAFVIALAVILERRGRRLESALGGLVVGAAIVAGIVGGATNVLTMGLL